MCVFTDPAVNALLAFLNIAPLALYFLTLGLVNCHAQPLRVSSRTDFVALTSVVAPLLFWPVPALVVYRLWWLIALEALAAAWFFHRLLPRGDRGWVLYNISEGRWRSAWDAAASAAGLRGEWRDRAWCDESGRLRVEYTSLPLLRNVSVETTAADELAAQRLNEAAARLDRHLTRIDQLPSTSGACLWVLGIALMLLPLWILGRHVHEVASALARLLG